jgi:hypothetical protein
MDCRTCNKCGWVYFGVSREYAENQLNEFNRYFDTLSREDQELYYGGKDSDISQYEKCWCGNDYTNFRDSREGDCPDGVTISLIISSD